MLYDKSEEWESYGTNRLFELGWIERLPNGRAVRVTAAGLAGLSDQFGLSLEERK
ncbi:hypothetical protein NDK47_21470 [Brevibacillus ruminantium]|uniref:ArsR family transcriptional regulator n=1 Tax=Brevibacillus ruminantium TaxID=2950604 RepID=A0ABY4WC98_9BACL|nr:hypothetical protein [Brevibacillus ruminantium]USG64687.1 hypothetical protein NDK47_21470 [Brevibacillus ruminantium]